MKGRVTSEEYSVASKLLANQKTALALYAEEVNKAAEEFRRRQQNLERTKDASLASAMENDLVFIMNLNVNYLSIDYQVRYVRSGYIENDDERAKERASIDANLQELRERALGDYLDGKFVRGNFPCRM